MHSDPLSTANGLWIAPPQRRSITIPITRNSLVIWDRIKTYFGLQSSPNSLFFLLRNPSFYPAWTELSSTWSNAGLIRAHHFFSSQTFTLFPMLRETHNPPEEPLKHLFSQNIPPTQTTFLTFERACNIDPHRRGLMSDLYVQLQACPTTAQLTYLWKWERDLDLTLDTADWSHIWKATISASPNIVTH